MTDPHPTSPATVPLDYRSAPAAPRPRWWQIGLLPTAFLSLAPAAFLLWSVGRVIPYALSFLLNGQYRPPTYEAVHAWYALFAIYSALSLPPLAIARLLALRRRPAILWTLRAASAIVFLHLFLLLLLPSTWLAHRIVTMGPTGNRIAALAAAALACCTLAAMLIWIVRRPRHCTDSA